MPSAYVSYDSRSGQIISMHQGPFDAVHAHERVRDHARRRRKIDEQHIAVIAVSSEAFETGKQYSVDLTSKTLVEVAAGQGGVCFSFGSTRRY